MYSNSYRTLEIVQHEQTLLLRLLHDLKMENAPEFYEEFNEANSSTPTTVVIDFSKIRFVDSSGVGMLIKCAHEIKDRQGIFQILGLNRSLHSVFKLAGLFRIFELLETEEAYKLYPRLQDQNPST